MHRTSSARWSPARSPRASARLRRRARPSSRRCGSALVVNVLSAALSLGRDRSLRRRLHACCSSAAPRRTSCGAAWPAACRCSSAGRPSPAPCVAAVILFLLIFFWTPPHYWPLSMGSATTTPPPACRCCRSCRRRSSVGRQIVLYSWVMVATSLVLVPVASMGWVYAAAVQASKATTSLSWDPAWCGTGRAASSARGGRRPPADQTGTIRIRALRRVPPGRHPCRGARRGDGVREPAWRGVRVGRQLVADRGHRPRSRCRLPGFRRAGEDAVLEGRQAGRPLELGRALGAFTRELATGRRRRFAQAPQ